MKNVRLLMAIIVMAVFASCKNDAGDIIDGGQPGINETYIALKLVIPNGSQNTKGDVEDSGDYETGIAAEYAVNTVDLYFFDNTGAFKSVLTIPGGTLTQSTPSGTEKVYYTSQKVGLEAGAYRIYALVNGGTGNPTLAINDPDATFKNLQITDTRLKDAGLIPASALTSGGWPMASRTAGAGISSPSVDITLTTANIITNPAPLNIEVERIVAKLAVASPTTNATNAYSVGTSGDDDECTITIDGYYVVNLSKDGYIFRHTADEAGGNIEYGNVEDIGSAPVARYVWDPKSASKTYAGTPPVLATGYDTWYVNSVLGIDNTVSFTTMPAGISFTALGYCLENTTFDYAQRNGYSTGMIFRGKIVPVKVYAYSGGALAPMGTNPANFYYYGNRFYATLSDLVEDSNNNFDINILNPLSAKQLSQTFNIEEFTAGYCYYTYWIKHQPSATDMDIMEFAIVRNNVYNMTITNILRPATGDIIIDPEDPDESPDVYMQMEMTIMPWIVRANEIILQ